MADVPSNEMDAEFIPEVDEPQATGQSLARLQSAAIAQPGGNAFSEPVEDRSPFIEIVHGVGKLAEQNIAPAGSLVLDKNVVIYQPPAPKKGGGLSPEEPALMTVLKVDEFWRERLQWPWPEGKFPREFSTEEEAIAAGLITQFPPRGSKDANDRSKWPNCGRAATLAVLLQEPEGVEDRSYYYVPIKDKWYAPAKLSLEKYSFAEVAPVVNRADKYSHRVLGLPAATFALTTKTFKVKSTGNFTWIPTVRIHSTKTEAEINTIYDLFGGRPSA